MMIKVTYTDGIRVLFRKDDIDFIIEINEEECKSRIFFKGDMSYKDVLENIDYIHRQMNE